MRADARKLGLWTALLCLAHTVGQGATPASASELVKAARSQIGVTLHYDGAYVRLAYPNGDVPAVRGVCTDVVIRALRRQGVDLQQRVHEDMRANFRRYPALWGMRGPDRNIDHRRVPNLETFFRRQGKEVAAAGATYQPGDIVSWTLENGLTHIGILSDRRSPDGRRLLVIHNIGAGTREEDVLGRWKQRGHFRW